MSDLATTPVDPAERGTLDVRAPAIVHTIEQMVLEVESVVRRSSRAGLGSGYPKASVTLHGSWASAEVEVTAAWPTRVDRVAEQVRGLVIDRVEPLTGVQIRTADVTVTLVTPDPGERRGRVS